MSWSLSFTPVMDREPSSLMSQSHDLRLQGLQGTWAESRFSRSAPPTVVRKRAGSRTGARWRLLWFINKGGFPRDLRRERGAQHASATWRSRRVSGSEVGCGELRWLATAVLVHQPRVLGPTQRRHLLATAEHSTVGLHDLDWRVTPPFGLRWALSCSRHGRLGSPLRPLHRPAFERRPS